MGDNCPDRTSLTDALAALESATAALREQLDHANRRADVADAERRAAEARAG
jgi:hypothetical protein